MQGLITLHLGAIDPGVIIQQEEPHVAKRRRTEESEVSNTFLLTNSSPQLAEEAHGTYVEAWRVGGVWSQLLPRPRHPAVPRAQPPDHQTWTVLAGHWRHCWGGEAGHGVFPFLSDVLETNSLHKLECLLLPSPLLPPWPLLLGRAEGARAVWSEGAGAGLQELHVSVTGAKGQHGVGTWAGWVQGRRRGQQANRYLSRLTPSWSDEHVQCSGNCTGTQTGHRQMVIWNNIHFSTVFVYDSKNTSLWCNTDQTRRKQIYNALFYISLTKKIAQIFFFSILFWSDIYLKKHYCFICRLICHHVTCDMLAQKQPTIC